MRRVWVLCCLLGLVGGVAPHAGSQEAKPQTREARFKAHASDFDYLLGDWKFTAKSKQYGVFAGVWSAVRLAQGQILDEYRVLDDDGQTVYLTTTIRAYNSAADRWELIGMDEGNGLQDVGVARRAGNEVHIEQTFGATGPDKTLSRIRYYNIQPASFSWASDSSFDGGKTWVTDHLRLEVTRIGPARSLAPLSGGKTPVGRSAGPQRPRNQPPS